MPLAYLESQIDDLRAQAERVQNQWASTRDSTMARRNPHGHRKSERSSTPNANG